MPAASPRSIVDAILQAMSESGHSAAYLNPSPREHPRRFAVTLADRQPLLVWIYVWTLTPGGRASLPDEFRIQMTTVSSPLAINPAGPTVLLGYESDLILFAGFDLVRHREFTQGSPSVQININTVRQSLQSGLTFDRKTNTEIAIGIRPDHLMDYIQYADVLHRYGRFADTFGALDRVAEFEQVSALELAKLSPPRRRIVEIISRLSRRGNFRQQVLYAYGNRCAVTRAQLRLVDAAHILPVGAPDSTDVVRNGVALAPTYHRAYDAGLIFLDDHYVMRVNKDRARELRALNLHGGLNAFRSHLGKINLPPDRLQWPDVEFIRRANQYRNI